MVLFDMWPKFEKARFILFEFLYFFEERCFMKSVSLFLSAHYGTLLFIGTKEDIFTIEEKCCLKCLNYVCLL